MKKWIITVFLLLSLFEIGGCGKKSMNQIIQSEPNITGIVEEVHDRYILLHCEKIEGYLQAVECKVSLDVENQDSMTHFSIGDEVTVYFNGDIAESDPLQINTVYAIVLKEPADRDINNKN